METWVQKQHLNTVLIFIDVLTKALGLLNVFCVFQVIMLLSGYCARMCTIDKDECTPLHYAAATGDVKCCKFLAQRGTVIEFGQYS